jgi:hypothetical protein
MNFIYADLHKQCDDLHSVILSSIGTESDLRKYNIQFEEGKSYWFWTDNEKDDPLIFFGTVHYSSHHMRWILKYDPQTIVPLSESKFSKEIGTRSI